METAGEARMGLLNLDPNLLIEIGLKLDPDDLTRLCESEPRFKNILCNNNKFWMIKYYRTYPTIERLPTNSNFQTIYLASLRIVPFQIYKNAKKLEVYDYVRYHLDEEDDREIVRLYPEIDQVDLLNFRCNHFVNGTKVWLAYISDFSEQLAFLIKEEAIDHILNYIVTGSPAETPRPKLSQITMETYRNTLETDGKLEIPTVRFFREYVLECFIQQITLRF